MLNGRAMCLGVLCVFFIPSTVLAQSQSSTETIIEKVFQSEIRVREHVDTKVAGIETKVDNLTTTVGNLSKDVTENKTNIENMQEDIRDLKGTVTWIWRGILGIFGTLILYLLKSWREGRGKTDSVGVVDRLTEQITELISAQAENSSQITRLISAQAAISETRDVSGHPKVPIVDELDGLTDDIQSQQRDKGERV
ncbi:MAG: hemolysin XhlA family protein [Candidatus Poribacteria bacterium]|nr:hemolysin XhlA family protein [Candidatus Poribacteria bacterium]